MMPGAAGNKRLGILAVMLIVVFIYVVYRLYYNDEVTLDNAKNEDPLSWVGVKTHTKKLVDWKQVDKVRGLPEPVDWSEIKKRKKPRKEDTYDKWIVVTSIAAPTNDVTLLSKIPGWKLLVVGDKKTPKSWRYLL